MTCGSYNVVVSGSVINVFTVPDMATCINDCSTTASCTAINLQVVFNVNECYLLAAVESIVIVDPTISGAVLISG